MKFGRLRGIVKHYGTGMLAFVIVLLMMPLGHTLMVLLENGFSAEVFTSAIIVGAIGSAMLWWGVVRPLRDLYATLLGAIGGVLVWTGWVEFSFVWVARKLNVAPQMVDGEVATKPEYLVMVSSLGLLGCMLLMFLFTQTRCTFFVWFQKRMGTRNALTLTSPSEKALPRPLAVIAFLEMVMIIWTFYLVLLLCYDEAIAGDRHPITWVVAFGSLFWSIHLIIKLVRIKAFDHAVRYAIPTVVIFWNFVEVMGRWGLFKEIWVHPAEHWLENSLLLGLLIFFVIYFMYTGRKDRQRRSRHLLSTVVQPGQPIAQ
ncbi:MAG: hypothetical protein IPI81_06725 [Flavobacteriales bacterium]|nr:hypothetical protein [Flavobacteriales bacterium]MCC6938690.1 hypothetical protein [Flavobacteriales bacterium]